jgi:hypothetical protein
MDRIVDEQLNAIEQPGLTTARSSEPQCRRHRARWR